MHWHYKPHGVSPALTLAAAREALHRVADFQQNAWGATGPSLIRERCC